MTETTTLHNQPFNRNTFDSLLKRRLFYTESFEIYRTSGNLHGGDSRGLFDYGPPGCALQSNIIDAWRRHVVLEEDMLEVDCTVLTPEEVFKTSGHVDKFEDWMCKDTKTGDYLRADHLVENVLEGRLRGDKAARGGVVDDEPGEKKGKAVSLTDSQVQEYEEILARIDNYNGAELAQLIERIDIRSPEGNKVLPPTPFNLMFKTTLGPGSSISPGYLRPENCPGPILELQKASRLQSKHHALRISLCGQVVQKRNFAAIRSFASSRIPHGRN